MFGRRLLVQGLLGICREIGARLFSQAVQRRGCRLVRSCGWWLVRHDCANFASRGLGTGTASAGPGRCALTPCLCLRLCQGLSCDATTLLRTRRSKWCEGFDMADYCPRRRAGAPTPHIIASSLDVSSLTPVGISRLARLVSWLFRVGQTLRITEFTIIHGKSSLSSHSRHPTTLYQNVADSDTVGSMLQHPSHRHLWIQGEGSMDRD